MAEPVAELRPVAVPVPPPGHEDDQEEEGGAPAAAPERVAWSPTLRESIREAWDGRHLLPGLFATALSTYQGYLLGRVWLFLRPFMQVFGFAVLFGGVFGARAPNGVPYLLFLVFSLQGWHTFQRTLMFQCRGAYQFKKLTQKLKVPLLLIPVAGPFQGVFYLGVYWLFAIPILVYYLITQHHLFLAPPLHLLVGLAGLLLSFGWGWAFGIPFSLLYMRAKDVRLGLRYGTQLWMVITPVFYSLSTLHGTARTIAQFNPLTGVMSLVQYGFLDAGTPQLYAVVWSVAGFFIVAIGGLWVFSRYAVRFIALGQATKDDEEDSDDVGML
jgi:ABC-type polysaccharide/polyol phosphate export permease